MWRLLLTALLLVAVWLFTSPFSEAKKSRWIELPGYIVDSKSVEEFLPYPPPPGRKYNYRFDLWRVDVDEKLYGELDCENGVIKVDEEKWLQSEVGTDSNEASLYNHFCKHAAEDNKKSRK